MSEQDKPAILFIGGCCDGEWQPDPGVSVIRRAKILHPPRFPLGPMIVEVVQSETTVYRHVPLTGGYLVSGVFLDEKISEEQLIPTLLNGYRPKEKTR